MSSILAAEGAKIGKQISGELKSALKEVMSPVVEPLQELKNAGISSLVKSVNIASGPVLDVLEYLSETVAPVFEPIFETLTEGIEEQLPEIQQKVQDMLPYFESLATEIPGIVERLPDIIELFIKFTGFSWDILITFVYTYGEDLFSILSTIANWMTENTEFFKNPFEFIADKLADQFPKYKD
jgi:phage-related protein